MGEIFCALDTETYYNTKDGYGLKSQTMWEYTRDPRFDCFLISVSGNNNRGEKIEWCGDPLEFDWQQLEGVTLVGHNASFDGLVVDRMRELGLIKCGDHEWVDTADLAAFLRVPRNLKGAAFWLLGVTMSKAVRTNMDGKKFRELLPEERAEWIKYALDDAKYTFMIWEKYADQWPLQERLISKYNREAGWRGFAVDRVALGNGIQTLHTVIREAEALMPWVADGEKAGSAHALRRHARAAGLVDVPASLKRDDPAMVAWVEKHKDEFPFIRARLDHASATPHYARLMSMNKLLDSEGIIRFDVLYHGANSGRVTASSSRKAGTESTSSRFNPLNIPRSPVFGVDIRGTLIPRPGYKFVIYDYAQIEARALQWLAGAKDFVEVIKNENLYQATAKRLGWFPHNEDGLKKKDPELYRRAKETALGAGYAMGAEKFMNTCAKKGLFISLELAKEIITAWRQANPEVVNFWRFHHANLRLSAQRHDAEHTILLPSWRKLTYFGPEERVGWSLFRDETTGKTEKKQVNELYAAVWKEQDKTKLYGGKLVENIVQSTARDIMYAAQIKISQERPQWPFMLNVYDELIFEVPDADVEDALREIPFWMCNAAEWAKGCPLEVEGGAFDRYLK